MLAYLLMCVAGGTSGAASGRFLKSRDIGQRGNVGAGLLGGLCIGQYVLALATGLDLGGILHLSYIVAGTIGGVVMQLLFGSFMATEQSTSS